MTFYACSVGCFSWHAWPVGVQLTSCSLLYQHHDAVKIQKLACGCLGINVECRWESNPYGKRHGVLM
ncbi:hypothetical protein PsorP6_012111 [Peronosclerospora sorghi]|uniref:Uncharacterized protein n=1 Tax=Peronosclerospora sorghi TaxID=230839 RepID=A0ACC0WKN7_9STRA|nr:hypothetical protein PsorP6_012111 [Peronosclerospora sorghi]